MAGTRLTPQKARDVLFSGVVSEFDEQKRFGWIRSEMVTELFDGAQIYVHKDVLDFAGCQVGDWIRFGVHLNNSGKPQASKPAFKIGANGEAIGIEAEDKEFLFAEDEVELDPQFLNQYQLAINMKSRLQNAKRENMGPYGKGKESGKSKGGSKGAVRGYGSAGAMDESYGEGQRLTPTKARDVLFSGVVTQYDEKNCFGWIQSDLVTLLFEHDCYIHKDVLDYAGCQVGDKILFGIHVSNRVKPQASKPVFKVGPNGAAIGIENESTEFLYAEEEAEKDPNFLILYQEQIMFKSKLQNEKKLDPPGNGKESGKSKGKAKGASRDYAIVPHDSYGGKGGGYGGYGASSAPPGGIDLKIDGIPGGVSHREIAHIFRQYAGFMSLRSADRGTRTLAFATFESDEQAQFVMDALQGYIFDDQVPQWEQSALSLQLSTNPKGAAKGSKGAAKGKW